MVLQGFQPLRAKAPLESHVLSAAILLRMPDVYEPLLEPAAAMEGFRASKYFGSPLYAAITSGQHDLARRLLGLFDAWAEQTTWPLMAAVKTGDLAMVEIVLGESGPAPGLAIDEAYFVSGHEVEPALARAARLGHAGIIQRLLIHIAVDTASFGM
ncbi:hypothetical protein JX266_007546 [Neoarthrinium moseri]|nr:hypothetical protein JX266_007546 [Neoarthrinium moseri]